MRRRAAAADGTAATVEQLQGHAGIATDRKQGLLRTVLRPCRCQYSRILGRIRVADHYHLLFR
jgi:hypothetical protein